MLELLILATEGAEGAEAPAGNALVGLLPFLLIGLVFYFLIIRPQRVRQKQQQAMVSQLSIGDRVVTIGGFHGTVEDVSEDIVRLELAPGLVVTLTKSAVARSLTEPAEILSNDEFGDEFGDDLDEGSDEFDYGDDYDVEPMDQDPDHKREEGS